MDIHTLKIINEGEKKSVTFMFVMRSFIVLGVYKHCTIHFIIRPFINELCIYACNMQIYTWLTWFGSGFFYEFM